MHSMSHIWPQGFAMVFIAKIIDSYRREICERLAYQFIEQSLCKTACMIITQYWEKSALREYANLDDACMQYQTILIGISRWG